jgi:biopolymer transport protein ExbD
MDLPRNLDTPPPPPSETVDIEVSFDGSVLWNGQQVTQSDLNSYIANEAIREPQPEVRVRVDRRAQYRYVAGVLFSLQRGGIKKMGVVADARGF